MSTAGWERALHGVQGGGVAKSAEAYLQHGHPVPGSVIAVADRLVWAGLVAVAHSDPVWTQRRLSLTDTGQTRYAQLSDLRGSCLPVPPAEDGTLTRDGGG